MGKALMLNPKAVALYLAGQWEAKGKPPPILLVVGGRGTVRVFDPLDRRRQLASGHNDGEHRETKDNVSVVGVVTSGAVEYNDWGKGYGLALYAGLALFSDADGIWSSSGGRSREADRLWNKMVRHRMAIHQEDGEEDEETNWCYETSGDEEIKDFGDVSGRVAHVQYGQEVCGDVTVTYEIPEFDYLTASEVGESGLVLTEDGASSYSEAVSKAISTDAIPPDLFAVMPFRSSAEFSIVLSALQSAYGAERALRRLTTRPDLIDVGGQLRISTPHSRRVADDPTQYRTALTRGIRTEEFTPSDPVQQPLFGFGGGRRRGLGGLGNAPPPTSISTDLRRYLEKFSDIVGD